MRIFIGFVLAVLLTVPGWGQRRGGFFDPTPTLQGGFPNIVFPGGTQTTFPGIQRSFGNALFPGGGGPHLNVPLSVQDPTALRSTFGVSNRGSSVGQHRSRFVSYFGVPYAVPVYVGASGETYDGSYFPQDAAAGQQPNIIVIYPPAQQQPVVVDRSGPGLAAQPQAGAAVEQAPPTPEAAHFLVAFKDHTIYSAIAYWVEGDTLHYFTSPNTHNQVSLSLVDRDLTERLNREAGSDMRLPR